jgi:hypothetical protein
MPAPAFYLRLALLPLVLVACRTRDNPNVCTTMEQGDCGPGLICNVASQRCEPVGPTDVGRPESKDGPVGGMTGTDGPAGDAAGTCSADAGCTADLPICSPAGRCVACLEPSHCTADPNRPACVDSTCVGCQGDMTVCAKQSPATPLCGGKGACVECNDSSDCNQATAPICVEGKCTRCTSDSQCQGRHGDNPGLCLAHLDGRCATEAEVIYVRANSPCVDGPNALGTADMPFCRPQHAIEMVGGDRRILLLRGQDPFTPLTVRGDLPGIAGGRISVIGQPGAVIIPGADVGVNVLGGDVYLRGLTISEGKKEGVVAQGAATVRLNQCVIKLNALGGLRATGGAGFEVVNTIFDSNGPGLLNGFPFGAAYLNQPDAARPGLFRFNTVIRNMVGVVCAAATQQLSSVLFYDNGRDVLGETDQRNCSTTYSVAMVDPLFDKDRQYWLTDRSPCKDKGDPDDHPPDDWKGEPRPGGMRSDCGADELHQE